MHLSLDRNLMICRHRRAIAVQTHLQEVPYPIIIRFEIGLSLCALIGLGVHAIPRGIMYSAASNFISRMDQHGSHIEESMKSSVLSCSSSRTRIASCEFHLFLPWLTSYTTRIVMHKEINSSLKKQVLFPVSSYMFLSIT